ncbi:mitochondrial RNA binding complex 1 subunit / MRB0880 [Leishmania donovani]|uniref:Mitochondrial RNA binding complex 1 subunit, putative n=1 Tax=Leishmania donovani TaxID=5661 RepID=A0A3Q8ID67_LEIDO|nr:hypothetical protein, conserved [Leishmania donovani]AYU80347.1 mitochondrial RNA binding complex 1 subunit, putative [Leishmania donovani]TPP54323.1 hypothetical protein CGC21_22410 [Leishmania donovani]CAJ1990336.1 mitochondrial RNA binding complex 1 subunit / MRB0880 [Leishmania donovani]CBZ35598.1 hypothetical protein, conserved [Leishmania donovani]VDZ46193.1 mitochondrial_RNA_binding_complex_1_subunit_putative/GeneDB:LmjF.28.1810 [Leishmania donovani]
MIRKLLASVSAGGAEGRPRGFLAHSWGVGCGLLLHVPVKVTAVAGASAERAAASCSLGNARRFYLAPSRICMDEASSTAGQQQQQTSTPGGPAGASSASANGSESALDVAMRVNKMKKAHQSGGANKKEVEQEAWHALNSLTEDQINNAEGKAVSLLLNAWAYFAKFWAKGKDGPL